VGQPGGTIKTLFEPVRGVRRLDWVEAAAAKRRVGALLALYAFATDGLTRWHTLNFGVRGLVDEPAHLATALVILGALIRVRKTSLDPRFGWTMLACSVLIDLDHLPLQFGSEVLTEGTSRPYTHALWTVLALTVAWAAARFLLIRFNRSRPATLELILSGAAWGLAAHFIRDIATAPLSFWWPATNLAVEVPYWSYAGVLVIAVIIGPVRRHSRSAENARDTAPVAASGDLRAATSRHARIMGETPLTRTTGSLSARCPSP
jgi:inner membrane protein